MLKDIPIQKAEDIGIAIIPRTNGEEASSKIFFWDVYLMNLQKKDIRFVLVNAESYGILNGNPVKTAKMRYYVDELAAVSAVRLELVESHLSEITNEYFLSFLQDGYLYEKKIVFVRGCFSEECMVVLPILGERGIMIN